MSNLSIGLVLVLGVLLVLYMGRRRSRLSQED